MEQVTHMMLYLALPLPGIALDSFEIHSFPRPVPTSPTFIRTLTVANLLVSEDRDLLVEMDSLRHCREVLVGWYLCPAPPSTRPGANKRRQHLLQG